MYEELWLGPSSGMAWNMSGWRRPFRLHHFAKHDAFLMSNPVTIGVVRGKIRSAVASSSLSASWPFVSTVTAVICLQEHLWLSAGQVWSLPLYRLAGLYAPANGEMAQGWSMRMIRGVPAPRFRPFFAHCPPSLARSLRLDARKPDSPKERR